MNSWTSVVALRIADYYLFATLLLLFALVAMWLVRQPIRRLTIGWVTMPGLIVLAVVCNVPAWPRVQVVSFFPRQLRPDSSASAGKEVLETPILVSSPPESAYTESPPEDERTIISAEVLAAWDESTPREPQRVAPVWAEPYPVSRAEGGSSDFTSWSSPVVSVFSTGVVIVLLWLVCGALQTRRLCREADQAPDSIKMEMVQIVGDGNRIPRLLLSRAIGSAIVMGILRPTILVPSRVAEEVGREGLRAALAHEWAHIQNRDLWLLAISRGLLLLLFAHPLFWFLRRRIKADQELVADATASGRTCREEYASDLVAWARLGLAGPAKRISATLAIREWSSQLERRIAMLLDDSVHVETSGSRSWRRICGVSAGIVVLLLSVFTLHPTSSAIADPTEAADKPTSSDNADASDEPETGGAPADDSDSLALLKELGATLSENEQGNVRGMRFREPIKNPADLARLRGLPMLESCTLYDSNLLDKDLTFLANLPTVESLSLNADQFTEEGIHTLRGLPELRKLSLVGQAIDDTSLHLLRRLPKLEHVHLTRTQVTQTGLRALDDLPKFNSLAIVNSRVERGSPDGPQFTDEGVAVLVKIGGLKSLFLSQGTSVSDAGLERLAALTELEHLTVPGGDISDAGLEHIGRLTKLKELTIRPWTPSFRQSRSRAITDSGLANLKGITTLEKLTIWGGEFSDAGMEHLGALRNLKWISLSRAKVTEEGLKHLRELPHLEHLSLSGTDLEFKDLRHFPKLKSRVLPRTERHEAAVVAIEKLGGRCSFHEHDDEIQVSVNFFRANIDDEDLAVLSGFESGSLRSLSLMNTPIGNDGLAAISGRTELQNLHLDRTHVNDDGMKHLAGLTNLRRLTLRETTVGDLGMKHLAGLASLETLELSETTVGDVGLKHLGELLALDELSLRGTRVRGPGLEHLAGLSKLKVLDLSATRIEGVHLKHLGPLPSLERLVIFHTRVDDRGLEHIKGMTTLRWLWLGSTQITDQGLKHLAELTNLEMLHLGRENITDDGLTYLAALKNLKKLDVPETGVTREGVERLRKALPQCQIQGGSLLDVARTSAAGDSAETGQTAADDETTKPAVSLAKSNEEELDSGAVPDVEKAIAALEGVGCRIWDREGEPGTAVNHVSASVIGGEQFDDRAMKWLRAFPNLEMVHLHRTKITDAGMQHLEQLTKLRNLSISHAQITDKGIAVVEHLTNLEELHIMHTQVSDEGLKHLKTLRNLRWLGLPGTRVTDEGLTQLKELPSIERIGLGLRGNVTDDGLRHLRDLPNLKGLQLSTDFTDAGLEHLTALTNLEELAVLGCRGVTDEGMASLAGLTRLTALTFMSIKLSDASMPHIGGLKQLRRLHLESDAITDAGFAELSDLRKLETLELWGLGITDKGLDALDGMNKLQAVTLIRMRITDAGLEKLKQRKTLRRLTVLSCDVTSTGVEELEKAIPGLRFFQR